MHFLSLPSVELAQERVRQRVKQGGHHIPADVVERCFQRSLANLEGFKEIADDWKVWDTATGNPELIDEKTSKNPDTLLAHQAMNRAAWKVLQKDVDNQEPIPL